MIYCLQIEPKHLKILQERSGVLWLWATRWRRRPATCSRPRSSSPSSSSSCRSRIGCRTEAKQQQIIQNLLILSFLSAFYYLTNQTSTFDLVISFCFLLLNKSNKNSWFCDFYPLFTSTYTNQSKTFDLEIFFPLLLLNKLNKNFTVLAFYNHHTLFLSATCLP